MDNTIALSNTELSQNSVLLLTREHTSSFNLQPKGILKKPGQAQKTKEVSWDGGVIFNEPITRWAYSGFEPQDLAQAWRQSQHQSFTAACKSGTLYEAFNVLSADIFNAFVRKQPAVCQEALTMTWSAVNISRKQSRRTPMDDYYKLMLMQALADHFQYVIFCHSCGICHDLSDGTIPTVQEVTPLRASQHILSLRCRGEICIGRPRKQLRRYAWIDTLLGVGFKFSHLRLAVKNQRVGLNAFDERLCEKTLAAFNQPHIGPRNSGRYFFNPETFFDGERLLLRIQHWTTTMDDPSAANAPIPQLGNIAIGIPPVITLCEHLLGTHGLEHYMAMKKGRCTRCALDFEYTNGDVKIVKGDGTEKDGNVDILTVWRDLGRCESLDDPRFRAHFPELDMTSDPRQDKSMGMQGNNLEDAVGKDWEVGTVKDMFQKGEYDVEEGLWRHKIASDMLFHR